MESILCLYAYILFFLGLTPNEDAYEDHILY